MALQIDHSPDPPVDPLELAGEYLALSRRWRTADPPLDDEEIDRLRSLRSELEQQLDGAPAPRDSRREWLRVPTLLEVGVEENAGKVGAWLTEIAGGGVFIAYEDPMPPGSKLSFEVILEKGLSLRLSGTVRWSRHGDHPIEAAGMGVEFDVLDDEKHERVMSMIEDALYVSLSR